MTTCYIGIGSNIGDRQKYIDSALEYLKKARGVKFSRVSSIYETDPVSDIPQGKFLNGVIEIETSLKPRELLDELNKIELTLGRVRKTKNAPRTIDLDMLYYGDLTLNNDSLTIPHPRINDREFVLKGLRELGCNGF